MADTFKQLHFRHSFRPFVAVFSTTQRKDWYGEGGATSDERYSFKWGQIKRAFSDVEKCRRTKQCRCSAGLSASHTRQIANSE
jgi:hypothetical protein